MLNIPSFPLFTEIIFSSPCIKYSRTCVRNSLTGNNLECKIYIQGSVRGQKRVLSFFSNKEERPLPTGIFKYDHHFMSLTAATYCCTKGMRKLRTSYIHTYTVNFDLENLKYVLLYQYHGMPIQNFNFFNEQHLFFFLSSAKQVAVLTTAVQMAPIYIAMDTTVVAYKSMVLWGLIIMLEI